MLSREKVTKALEPTTIGLMNSGFDLQNNLNELDNEGLSVLHRAVRVNDAKTVAYLLDRGAIIDLVGEQGCTPLHTAVR